jgi:hypothetical protein
MTLRHEGIDFNPLDVQLFWQEDVFDSTRRRKDCMRYFSNTHDSSPYGPEKIGCFRPHIAKISRRISYFAFELGEQAL